MGDSPTQSRSRSGSLGLGRPPSHSQPLAIPGPTPTTAAHEPTSAPAAAAAASPSSALSASLKAFADLALADRARSPPSRNPLDSHEFRAAFHHARRASFGASADAAPPALPLLSSSPSSSSEAGTSAGSLPTPSSSPPTSTAVTGGSKARTTNNNTAGNGKAVRAPSSTLGGVCERPELEFELRGELPHDDSDGPAFANFAMSAPAPHIPPAVTPPTGVSAGSSPSGLFAGGARWGWPSAAANNGPLSPPAPEPFALQKRRGSISFVGSPAAASTSSAASGSSGSSTVLATSPPTGDPMRVMQPLGRVVSAGAALQTPQDKAGVTEGLGIFRRFSISGIGARKNRAANPSSPPVGFSAQPAPTLLEPTHASLPPPIPTPASATAEPTRRGRTLAPPAAGGGAKAKRRISPMGERILRGGY